MAVLCEKLAILNGIKNYSNHLYDLIADEFYASKDT